MAHIGDKIKILRLYGEPSNSPYHGREGVIKHKIGRAHV